MFNKKGVSLITVLLFMLIATIAGTATYKWLSSAHGSSASRMNIAEAQQASNAGLDAVRAWMTYHANDVGAVIRQYIDGGKKPVRLDAVVKAFGSHKQDYSVWLTGVEASTQPYRLKITSVGTARGGAATYSENSILKVNGLYRVKIPEKLMGLHFNDPFAGGHAGITSNDFLQSGLITGDFSANNTPVIDSKMVITGNAVYGGNITHGGDVYIGENITAPAAITIGSNNPHILDTLVAYVGGNITCASGQPITVYGDLYIGGSVSGCNMDIKGNLTVAGNLKVAANSNSAYISVDGNMVFTETGSLDYNLDGTSFNRYSSITVGGNLYLPKTIEAHCTPSGQCGDMDKDKTIEVTGKVYQYSGTTYYKILYQKSDESEVGIYKNTTVQNSIYDSDDYNKKNRIASISALSFETQTISSWDKDDDVLKNVSGKYWTKIDKMNAYGRLIVDDAIPQPLLVDHENAWKAQVANEHCAGIDDDGDFYMDDAAIDALNLCYTTVSQSQLYNGFLVIKWNNTDNKHPTHTLDHKFVLYSTEVLENNPVLPATSANGMVFLYLEQGAGRTYADGGDHNYVVISRGDIEEINGLILNGTMILEQGSSLLKTQGGTRLEFDQNVVSTMISSGLIRENPEFTRLVDPTAEPAAAGVANAGTDDAYYVSTAPQLNISLESRYKNKEIDPATLDETKRTDIQASVIVMPRVVYVTQDLVGRLSDYYSVLSLNKAADNGDGTVNCAPAGLTPGMTYDGTVMVPEEIYTCNYQSNYGDNPFYVVVSGRRGQTPAVSFEEPNWAQISAGGSPATINMRIQQATGSATMYVGVNVYNLPESWTLHAEPGVVPQAVTSGVDGMRSYLVTFNAANATKPLFKLSAPSNAEAATVHFELAEPLSGCVVGSPASYEVSVSGSATINRVAIPATYCAGTGHANITGSDNVSYNCASVTSPDWPNCDNTMQKGVWVYPYCNSLTTVTENSSWTCGTNYAIHLEKRNISPSCVAFVPDTSLEAENGESYTLYGSLKRKPYKLYVKTEGANSVTTQISVKDAEDESAPYTVISSSSTENGYQVYQVYSNYRVKAEAKNYGSNRFNYWGCAGVDCDGREVDDHPVTEPYLISGTDTLTAYFNKRDEHCFYDSFGNMENSKGKVESFEVFCSRQVCGMFSGCRETCDADCQAYENCVDYCVSENHCSVGVPGQTYQGYDPSANWMLVYGNKIKCKKRGIIFCKEYSYDGFAKPVVTEGFIRAPGVLGNLAGIIDYYRPTMLLHRVKAGTNGKMSLKMKVPSDMTESLEDLMGEGDNSNDGVVLRSDASGSSYLSINLFKGSLITEGQLGAMVRVCYVKGLENEGDDCLTSPLKNIFNGNFAPLTRLTDITMNITLDGASLKVDLDYNTEIIFNGSHYLGSVIFDLSDLNDKSLAYGAEGHEYVGIKMFNTFYQYKDISWASETYSNDCYNTPRIYCSFANQYLGGTVPKNENVTPWVGVSSWFDEQKNQCEDKEFYYNGCDMSGSLYTKNFKYLTHSLDCSKDGLGGFWGKGSKLNGSTYNFEDQGYHKIDTSKTLFGDYKLSGYAKNASVQITCGSTTYSTDCGQFYVGDIVPCAKHELSFEQNVYCGSDPCFVNNTPDGDYANLRDATISMTISDLNGTINVYLIDQNDVASSPYPINADGVHEFNVSQVLEKIGFDPQMVKSVRFEGATGFTVSGLQSYCSHAPGIFDCTAAFDGSGFIINSSITNSINAASGGCTVSNNENDGYLDDVTQDCPANGTFYVPGSNIFSGFGEEEDSKCYRIVRQTERFMCQVARSMTI